MDINDLDLSEDDEVLEEPYVDDESDNDVDSEFSIIGAQRQEEQPIVSNDMSDRAVLNSLLKHYGIADPSKIAFEDEYGNVSEKNWDELPFEDKMNILKTSYNQPERDLDDDEVNLINEIRKRNMSPEQYINQIKQDSISNYTNLFEGQPQVKIDDLSDDEIFILDLQDKIEDITDEEITQALEAAKQNEKLFKRQMAGLRADLKKLEDAYNQQMQLEAENLRQEQFNYFANQVNESVGKFDSIGDLDLNLDDNDRDDIMSFILDVDDTGMSTLGKALNDPDMLVKLSWFALHGEEAFKTIQNYFAQEITKANQSGYKKGLEEGKKGTSKVVYTRPVGQPKVLTLDDLY